MTLELMDAKALTPCAQTRSTLRAGGRPVSGNRGSRGNPEAVLSWNSCLRIALDGRELREGAHDEAAWPPAGSEQ